MKIAVSSTGENLDSPVDPRFGRAEYFLIVDTGPKDEGMNVKVFSNEAAMASGGAGIQTAQTISELGVEVVITGNVGPNAFRTLNAAGVRIITGASGTVKEAIHRFVRGELSEPSGPTSASHSGMGGMGSGGGAGGGRGGMGQGMGPGAGGGAGQGRGMGRRAGGR
ncbi:MAG: NifB/NifX family molybdenum-iron cluster-binding protein [Candidatus Thermoplasmatota archaeon]|nr:NifB/NifX family molybdenum-iron cluster-binding protein [Candidatus Thermoplasmatota archaeon]